MACTSCMEARNKLLAARNAREAAEALALAIRINAEKAKQAVHQALGQGEAKDGGNG